MKNALLCSLSVIFASPLGNFIISRDGLQVLCMWDETLIFDRSGCDGVLGWTVCHRERGVFVAARVTADGEG